MPYVLLLHFVAPMQSWGISSRFQIRDTAKEPSKSGVVGLLCAALGVSRDEANEKNDSFVEITKLKMGVRVLCEGMPESDFHTAQKVAIADSEIKVTKKIKTKNTELSKRHYLADADFLVGLESDDLPLLESLQKALKNPKWQLFLGRKAFVPSEPIYFSDNNEPLRNGDCETVLREFEIECKSKEQRLIMEDENGTEVRQDVPLDFANRRFSIRRVRTEFIKPKGGEKDDGDILNENDFESEMSASAA